MDRLQGARPASCIILTSSHRSRVEVTSYLREAKGLKRSKLTVSRAVHNGRVPVVYALYINRTIEIGFHALPILHDYVLLGCVVNLIRQRSR